MSIRADRLRKQGRRAVAFELSETALRAITEAQNILESGEVIPHCSQVQAVEVLIREGLMAIKKKT